jgi:hypothetical protein
MIPKLFQDYFLKDSLPHWPCPSCERGVLRLRNDTFHTCETAATKLDMKNEYFEHEWSKSVFNGILTCGVCDETVVFCGDGGVKLDWDGSYYVFYIPKYFNPPIPVIRIPASDKVPQGAVELLTKSFELFWCDPDARANRLRSTLEVLLDNMEIPRDAPKKKKPGETYELTLHDRIDSIKSPELQDVKNMMLAVKWLGNAGSHELQGIHHS